jgi:multidrug efflux pump subunit AcrA (membrane-fusion protein)
MRKLVIWIVIIVVLCLAGFRAHKSRQRTKHGAANAELKIGTPVEVVHPVIGDISSMAHFVGNIKGEDQVQVFAEAPGKLLKYTVAEGQKVAKGNVIALVDRAITGMDFEPLKVKSPISGVVGSLPMDRGAAIAPQIPVAVVARMNRVKIVFSVGEKELGVVKQGAALRLTVDTYPGDIFNGKITKISPIVDPMTRSLSCEGTIPNPQHRLKPGMFAEVEVVTATQCSVILVPENVIVRDLGRGTSHVFIIKDSVVVKTVVEVGASSRDTVEIVSGLAENEAVVSKGQHFLTDGESVRIIEQKARN